MEYVLEQFERRLKDYVESCTFDKTLFSPVFEKKSTDNPFGDYSAFLSNKKCKKDKTFVNTPNLLHEIKDVVLSSKAENWSLIIDSIKIDCNRMILKLNREHTNHTGLEFVNKTRAEYGTNTNFRNKVFIIKQEIVEDKIGLTDLRTELTSQLIKNLIVAGGGTVDENQCAGIELLNVGRTCFGKNAVTIGTVKTINNNPLSRNVFLNAEEYRNLRRNDIHELNEHRIYHVKDAQCFVNASLCFDMLSTKIYRPVILDVCSVPMAVREYSTKGAVFVLYNYARICRILDLFYNKVAQKFYDPLPPISKTHTELLTQKEEWSLMFDYILEWPEVVCTCQNLLSLKLHSICNFLSSLSLCFSVFYRRCRILTAPLPQLLPVMYARIHLLLALKQVFENGFSLLSFEGPTNM